MSNKLIPGASTMLSAKCPIVAGLPLRKLAASQNQHDRIASFKL